MSRRPWSLGGGHETGTPRTRQPSVTRTRPGRRHGQPHASSTRAAVSAARPVAVRMPGTACSRSWSALSMAVSKPARGATPAPRARGSLPDALDADGHLYLVAEGADHLLHLEIGALEAELRVEA